MLSLMADSAYNQLNRTSAALLITDLELGLTFLHVAETSTNEETIRRNRQNARTVYDTTLRLLSKLTLNNEEWNSVEVKLSMLKERLAAVGEPI